MDLGLHKRYIISKHISQEGLWYSVCLLFAFISLQISYLKSQKSFGLQWYSALKLLCYRAHISFQTLPILCSGILTHVSSLLEGKKERKKKKERKVAQPARFWSRTVEIILLNLVVSYKHFRAFPFQSLWSCW